MKVHLFHFSLSYKYLKKIAPHYHTYMVVKMFLDIHQKAILQKLNIKAVGNKLSNYLSDFNL